MAIDPQQEKIMGYFIEEAREHLDTIYNGLQNFSNAVQDQETMHEMYRAAHSIKGGAAMLGVESVRLIAYYLEDFFKVIKENSQLVPDQQLTDLFMEAYAYLPQLLNQLEKTFEIPNDMAEAAISASSGTMERLGAHLHELLQAPEPEPSEVSISPIEQFASVVQAVISEIQSHLAYPRTEEGVESLLNVCDELEQWGDYLQQPTWNGLISLIREVINNPFNSFEVIGAVLPNEIAIASELVMQGRGAEIQPSLALQELLTPTGAYANQPDEETSHIFSSVPLEDQADQETDGMLPLDVPPPVLGIDHELDWTAAENADTQANEAPQIGTAEIENLAQLFEQEQVDMDTAWEDMEENDTQILLRVEAGETAEPQADVQEFLAPEPDSFLLGETQERETTADALDALLDELDSQAPELVDDSGREETANGFLVEGLAELPLSVNEADELDTVDNLDNFLANESNIDNPVDDLADLVVESIDTLSVSADVLQVSQPERDTETDELNPVDDFLAIEGNLENPVDDVDDLLVESLADLPASTDEFFADETEKNVEAEIVNPVDDLLAIEGNLENPVDDVDDLLVESLADLPASTDEFFVSDIEAVDNLLGKSVDDLPVSAGMAVAHDLFVGEIPEHSDAGEDFFSDEIGSAESGVLSVVDELSEEFFTSDTAEGAEMETSEGDSFISADDSAVETLADFFVDDSQEQQLNDFLAGAEAVALDDPENDPLSAFFGETPVAVQDASDDLFVDGTDNVPLFTEEQTEEGEAIFPDLFESPSASSVEADIFSGLGEEPASVADSVAELDILGLAEVEDANWADLMEPSEPVVERSDIDELSAFFDDDDELQVTDNSASIPSAPATEVAEDISQFSELEALLNANVTDTLSELEALIGNTPTDTFSELEAMLSTPTPVVGTEEDILASLELALGDAPPQENVTTLTKPEGSAISAEGLLAKKLAAQPSAPPLPPRPAKSSQPLKVNNVRVDVKYLDSLNNLVGELVVNRNLLGQDQERLQNFLRNLLDRVQQLSDVSQRMRDQYDRSLLESSVAVGRSRNQTFTALAKGGISTSEITQDFEAIEFDRYNTFHILSQEIIELIVKIKESASDIEFVITETEQVTRELGRIASQIQDDLKQSRMVPFSNLADRLPRGVRDRAVKSGKQAELVVVGGETLIDKSILEQLTDPMTHLVNNAVDHGLESPEERVRKGKPPYGTIEVKAFHQGNQTMIVVKDDGGGINPEKVKEKAVKKGLKTPEEVAKMTTNEAYALVFMPGFSTRDAADQFAGRGVGLDVVKSCLDSIKGSIYIDSEIDKGTQFTIRLPLTLSISKAVFCVSDRVRLAIPLDGFEDMVEIPRSQVIKNNIGQDCILWQDTYLPIQPLSNLLTFTRKVGGLAPRTGAYLPDTEDLCVIVVRDTDNNYLGLQVDQFLGEFEIVVKQLEGPIPKPPGIAGATVLGDGRVVSIVNVLELFEINAGKLKLPEVHIEHPSEDITHQSQPVVLIVDDSIVVREMLSATFSKVGYFVEVARDGQDAYEKLRGGLAADLIFCDIEMPRMDGMELLATLQKDEVLSKIPMAMLTSRGADKHRQKAIQLGAKAYFTKPYLEEELLTASQRLLKGEVLV